MPVKIGCWPLICLLKRGWLNEDRINGPRGLCKKEMIVNTGGRHGRPLKYLIHAPAFVDGQQLRVVINNNVFYSPCIPVV